MLSRIFKAPTEFFDKEQQKGFFLVELMAVIIILSILGLGLMRSNVTSITTRGRAEIRDVAIEVAVETLEEYASLNPINLNENNNIEGTLVRNGYTFMRTADVVVNDDSSRTVTVQVGSNNPLLGSPVILSVVYPVWGSV